MFSIPSMAIFFRNCLGTNFSKIWVMARIFLESRSSLKLKTRNRIRKNRINRSKIRIQKGRTNKIKTRITKKKARINNNFNQKRKKRKKSNNNPKQKKTRRKTKKLINRCRLKLY